MLRLGRGEGQAEASRSLARKAIRLLYCMTDVRPPFLNGSATTMDVRTALRSGDAAALRRILSADPAQANALVAYGENCQKLTHHPLHYISDLVFNGMLPKGTEMPLVEALLEAGSDVDFGKADKHETNLIGAASLGAEDVGIRLLDAGSSSPHAPRRRSGETRATLGEALFGELRIGEEITPCS